MDRITKEQKPISNVQNDLVLFEQRQCIKQVSSVN